MNVPAKKKSGAAFRKEKQKRLLAAAGSHSTQPKLNFLLPASDLHGCIGSKIDGKKTFSKSKAKEIAIFNRVCRNSRNFDLL